MLLIKPETVGLRQAALQRDCRTRQRLRESIRPPEPQRRSQARTPQRTPVAGAERSQNPVGTLRPPRHRSTVITYHPIPTPNVKKSNQNTGRSPDRTGCHRRGRRRTRRTLLHRGARQLPAHRA